MTDMIAITISAVLPFLNSSVFPLLLAGSGIIYFGWMYYKANKVADKNRSEVQRAIINQAATRLPKKEYYVASAGSKESDACIKASAIDIELCNLCDQEGKPLDLSLYNCYIVHGDSMKYAGINDKDFILVPTDFNLDSLKTFPEILLIRYREQNAEKPLYKVRRAWFQGSIDDDLEKVAKQIVNMPKFKKLTEQEGYKGAEWMINDLKNKRLEDYKAIYFKDGKCLEQNKQIVISTTYDTIKKEIHFSIHPVYLIEGIVKEAYTIK